MDAPSSCFSQRTSMYVLTLCLNNEKRWAALRPVGHLVLYIAQSTNQGGGGVVCISGFFKTFLQKLTVLSDQEVPGCHKNIYRDLRPSFTRSEIFGNMCCFFRQQTQHLLPSLGTGSPKGALWEFVGKVIFSLFDPKNRFSAYNGPINIAGGRLDILFHFPNDWYNNIEG